MKNFSYVFAGASEISIKGLKILFSQKGFYCKGIITQTDRPRDRGLKKQASALKGFALSYKIPCWTPLDCGELAFLKEIRDLKADFCFVCAYGKILPPVFLSLFPNACLNLHFSLLPRWRGAAPVQRALMAGDLETGVSLQVMAEELDAGDLIGLKNFPIEENDHSLSLFEKSFQATELLLQESLRPYLEGKIQATLQDSSKANYAKKIDKSLAQIDWKEESRRIHNKIRALYLGPQAFCFLPAGSLSLQKNKKRLKIYRSQINNQTSASGFLPGEICRATKKRLSIACGKGVLDLLEVQQEGKKRQRIQDFLAGCSFQLKDRLI